MTATAVVPGGQPMPNLVDNRMVVRGQAADLARFLRQHLRPTAWWDGTVELDFGSIIPVAAICSPNALIAAWGTKWNARETVVLMRSSREVEVTFVTPWSLPEPVYRRLGQRHPRLTFLIEAIDPDLWAIEGRVEGDRADFREAPDFQSMFDRFYVAFGDDCTSTNGRIAGSDADGILIRTIERKYR
jgi:hypothetical protein